MRIVIHRALLAALCLALGVWGGVVARAAASEPEMPKAAWPMFRGDPALNGVAAGKLSTPLTLRWTYKTGGAVRSSPAVADGRVFVGSDDERLHAVDFAKGTNLWSFKTGGPIESSPLVLEGKVFIGCDDGVMRAFDAAKGNLLWSFPTGDKIPGSPNFTRAADGKGWSILFGSFDSRLYCLDAGTGRSNWAFETDTGNVIWTLPTRSKVDRSPAICADKVVVGSDDGRLYIVSLKDGKEQWSYAIGQPITSSPAVADGKVVVGCEDGNVYCFGPKEAEAGRQAR